MRAMLGFVVAGLVWCASPAVAQDSTAARRDAITWGEDLPVDQIVAVVGSTPILWSDVLFSIAAKLRGQRPPADAKAQRSLAEEALNQLINEEVLVQKAKSDTAIKVTDADLQAQVDQAFKRVRDQFRSDAELRDALKREALGSVDEYRKKLTDDARRQELQTRFVQKMKQDGRMLPAAVSDAELEESFNRAKAQFPPKPPTVAFRQIAVTPKPSEAARKAAIDKITSIAEEIAKGADFELLAKRESMDGSKDVGGDLGWNRRGKMVPAFDRMMFALPPNVVSPVVETVFGFHLIRVDRVQPGEVKARHILIRPTVDTADVRLAKSRADTLSRLWAAGASFDSLVTAFHDESEDKGSIEPFDRTQLPERYQKALEGKAKGDIAGPFEVPDPRGTSKFFVLQVVSANDGGEYTLDEIRDRIREQRSQEKSIERLLGLLKKEIHVAVLLGPTLPTPLN